MQYVASIFKGKYSKDSVNFANNLEECTSMGFQAYMNARDVRQALHIPDKLDTWSYQSMICYLPQYETMKPQVIQ